MHEFQGYFSRTFQVLEFFAIKKIQDFPGGVGTLTAVAVVVSSIVAWKQVANKF